MSSKKPIRYNVFRARGDDVRPAIIEIGAPIPEACPQWRQDWESVWSHAIVLQADCVVRALIAHLPQGVLDHVTAQLMRDRASLLAVRLTRKAPRKIAKRARRTQR